jgi:diguanylate cyclase (GGDEF)-like protein
MTGTARCALLPAFPDFGPLHPVVAQIHARLVDGELEEVVSACAVAGAVVEALGDRVSGLSLDYLSGQALLELDRPQGAAVLARRLLARIGLDGDRFWRAKALALLASAEVDQGAILSGLDALAEALGIVESLPPTRYHHISACSMVAGVLTRLLLFEPAAQITAAAARGAARGRPEDMLGPATAVLLVRRLAEIHAVWAAQLDLLDEGPAAIEHHVATVSAALWMNSLARQAGSTVLVGCAVAVEAFATERLLGPDLPGARARAALAVTPYPDTLVEWLPGRVALARAAAAEGRLAEAHELVTQVERAGLPRHREAWAWLMQLAAAEEEAQVDATCGGEHPAVGLWRELAASALRRIWQERDARMADLRHRILRRELDARAEQTRRELLIDGLTGLGNRRQLEQELESGQAQAALFLDVDNFKWVNDCAGHAVGDDVLRRLAALLRESCRATDVLVRYGGDEFVVLLEDDARAGVLGTRIMERVRAEDWPAVTGGIEVTVSVGIARTGTVLTALRRSDAALRLAKRSGRDALVEL